MKNRKFTTNSKNYTDKHNEIMDLLLWGYTRWLSYIGENDIEYDENEECYYPTAEKGLEVLEHLRDCDLICEVREDEEYERM